MVLVIATAPMMRWRDRVMWTWGKKDDHIHPKCQLKCVKVNKHSNIFTHFLAQPVNEKTANISENHSQNLPIKVLNSSLQSFIRHIHFCYLFFHPQDRPATSDRYARSYPNGGYTDHFLYSFPPGSTTFGERNGDSSQPCRSNRFGHRGDGKQPDRQEKSIAN